MLKPADTAYDHLAVPLRVLTSPAKPALEARDISVRLGTRFILRGINLTIHEGEVLAIIGPSGCGKSTFVTALNGMIQHTLPEAAVEGLVLLGGQSVGTGRTGQESLRKRVAMVFQRPNPFPYSIRRNIEFALKAAGLSDKSEMPDRIEEALRAVHLWDRVKNRLSDPATRLSGGEQQRLCIARALVSGPDVILLDEPCSALDPIACNAIEGLVNDLRSRAAIGIVTHNLAQAHRVSDRCAMFWPEEGEGRVIEVGRTDDIIRRPTHPVTRGYVAGNYC
jgi:phosphate transport system ATP-binding protein